MQEITQQLDRLREIGDVDALAKADSASPAWKVNAHIHLPPNFSAFSDVQQAVDKAAGEQVAVLGVSNYYDYRVYADFTKLAADKKIMPLFGLEIICLLDDLLDAGVKINDPGNPGKMYLCGKGIVRFDSFTSRGQTLLNKIRNNDSERMAEIIEKLNGIFAAQGIEMGLSEASVSRMIVNRHGSDPETIYLQERHLCQAFQEKLFELFAGDERTAALTKVYGDAPKASADDVVATQNEIRSRLVKAGKPAFVSETFVNFDEARELVLELGGVPSYPTLVDGASPICAFEATPGELISRLKERGIYAAEFIPLRNSPEVLSEYVKAMRDAGIVVTAGTEHNTLDLVDIEPTCKGGAPVPADLQAIFREGACVMLGHQLAVLQGKAGYVVDGGALNSSFADHEARIKHFAAIGAAAVEKYRR